MAEGAPARQHRAPGRGRSAGQVACAQCRAPVDPLRAARVSIYHQRFHYFCSARCHERFDPEAGVTPLPVPRQRAPGAGTLLGDRPVVRGMAQRALMLQAPGGSGDAAAAPSAEPGLKAEAEASAGPPPLDDEIAALEALADLASEPHASGSTAPARVATPERPVTDLGPLLLALAGLAGALTIALALAGGSQAVLLARSVLAVVGAAALSAHSLTGRSHSSSMHPVALNAASVAGALAALAAVVVHAPAGDALLHLTGWVSVLLAGAVGLMRRARRASDGERANIAAALEQPAKRVVGDEAVSVRSSDLRPGEEIVLEAGDVVPVDVAIVAGTARVLLWLNARQGVERAEGDSLVAGSQLVEGRLRAMVAWAGHDRAWARLTLDPRRRAELHLPLARAGLVIAERVAPFLAGLAALTAYAADQGLFGILLYAVATQAAFASPAIAEGVALRSIASVLEALRHGIVFRSPAALERAGRVSSVAFLARGTLLLGEPEVANVEVFSEHSPEAVLALVAGAESGSSDPVSTALLRAARARGVRADGVRNPTRFPGLGVTAIAATGQPLVIGSRALMLRERVSVAKAEARVLELEGMGRSVLLVSLGGRLIGLVALQDGLRSGARAAVQHLLDVGVEPVLLSGDSRETCDALARVLDIDHVRPEVLPADRGDEIRRLADGGSTVAVVGLTPNDDIALTAADLAIVLESAGSPTAEWDVQLVSDDVRDAALAVRIAHRGRVQALWTLGLAVAPGAAATLAMVFSLVSPAVVPLAAFAGVLAGLYVLRGGVEAFPQ